MSLVACVNDLSAVTRLLSGIILGPRDRAGAASIETIIWALGPHRSAGEEASTGKIKANKLTGINIDGCCSSGKSKSGLLCHRKLHYFFHSNLFVLSKHQ